MFLKRSKIIIMSANGETNQKIGAKIGLHYINVAKWRNRFMENLPNLQEIEKSAPEKLSDEIVRILSDAKRSGVKAKLTPEQIIKIVDLVCKNPTECGYEVSHWSLPLLVSIARSKPSAFRRRAFSSCFFFFAFK